MGRIKLTYWLSVIALMLLCTSCGKTKVVESYSIIPEPVYMAQKGRTCTLTSSTKLCFENLAQNSPTAKLIATSLRKKHVRPAMIGKPNKDCITFTINDSVNPEIGDEGYLLQVRPEGVFISANTETGLFYGFMTFVQMLPPEIHKDPFRKITLPECTILDYPRFGWRGSHLDCSRHFFTVKEIKHHLEIMATYKLNKFHWQLADDQGWRIEIDQYPQLNDVGSWRVDRGHQPWGQADPARPGEEPTYGGFYSKREIAEIVAYAAERHIEVIPEIDLTSHCGAILAAYPELSCDGQPHSVALGPCWPATSALCAGNPEVISFLTNLLGEVADLFPSEYIHIGANESSKEAWEQCPKCQARMRHQGLKDETALQGWLISQIEQILEPKGKRIIGWDDIMNCPNLSNNALVMATRGDTNVTRGAFLDHGIIAAAPEYCNLDCYQADTQYHPTAIPQYLPLHKVYQYDPMPPTLAHNVQQNLLGGEATLWTDYITNYKEAQYMLLPRLCALAECFWTPTDKKDWHSFQQRIEQHKQMLDARGFHYCPGSFRPVVLETPTGGNVSVELTSEVADTYIYYTLDGSDPTPESAIYQSPLTVAKGTVLRTLTLYNGKAQEGIYTFVL